MCFVQQILGQLCVPVPCTCPAAGWQLSGAVTLSCIQAFLQGGTSSLWCLGFPLLGELDQCFSESVHLQPAGGMGGW